MCTLLVVGDWCGCDGDCAGQALSRWCHRRRTPRGEPSERGRQTRELPSTGFHWQLSNEVGVYLLDCWNCPDVEIIYEYISYIWRVSV